MTKEYPSEWLKENFDIVLDTEDECKRKVYKLMSDNNWSLRYAANYYLWELSNYMIEKMSLKGLTHDLKLIFTEEIAK